MKILKFLMAGCLVLAGIGVVGTGVTLGEMYQTNQIVYEASDSEVLNQAALENVYIESDVPVRIMPTEGQARVEFSASGQGLMIPEPKYNLEVTNEGKSSYINLKEVQGSEVYLFTNNIRQELVVYLPEKDINTLKVTNGVSSNYYGAQGFTYTSKANIKELVLRVGRIDLDLKGNYGQMDIQARSGNMAIHSNTPAIVNVQGGNDVKLTGQLQQVTVKDSSNGGHNNVFISSDIESKIDIDNSYSNVIIEEKVKDVTMTTNGGSLMVNSESPYEVILNANDQVDVNLKGKIERATIEGNYGQVKLYPTGTPKRIEVLGEQMDVHAVLPADISGFEIKRKVEGYSEGEMGDFYADFEVKSETINEQLRRIYFGDEAMKMFIGSTYGEVYITK